MHKATEHICKLYQRFYTQTIYPKVIRNLYAIPPSLFVPSAPPWHCITSVPSVTPCAYYIRLLVYHSIFRKNLLLPYYHVLNTCYYVFYYPITMSWIPCYHVSYYPVPCLLLPCTMSLITLSHVFHYSVTMSLITLSPSRNAKPQKRVDKLIIPRSHTPQNN